MPGAITRRHMRVDLISKRNQTNCVLLAAQQVRQRRREKLRILKLCYRARVRVVHRIAGVDQQVTLRVRISAILLDEVAIGATEQTPIEIAQVVAGIVLTILGEFSREASERRAM